MRALILGAVAVVVPLMTGEARALTVWQGDAVIRTATLACSDTANERRSIEAGTVLRSILRPKLVDNNGNDTRVAFFHDSQAVYLAILAGGAMPAGSLTAYGTTHSGVIVANAGDPYSAFGQTPATITAGTNFVTLTGTLQDFLFRPGCTVSFRATYTRRPANS